MNQKPKHLAAVAKIAPCLTRGHSLDLICRVYGIIMAGLQENRQGSPTLQVPSWFLHLTLSNFILEKAAKQVSNDHIYAETNFYAILRPFDAILRPFDGFFTVDFELKISSVNVNGSSSQPSETQTR